MKPTEPASFGLRRSVVDAFRADEPDPATVQRAYVRFSWARRRPSPRLGVLYRWLAVGAGLGFGVASAATVVSFRRPSPEPSSLGAPAAAPPNDPTIRRPPRRPRALQSPAASSSSGTLAGDAAKPGLATTDDVTSTSQSNSSPASAATETLPTSKSSPRTEAHPLDTAPSPVRPGVAVGRVLPAPGSAGDRDRATQGPRDGDLATAAGDWQQATQGLRDGDLATAAGDWQQAARGLRDGDLATAEAALMRLERRSNPADREAAQLARAQLLISRNRQSEARPILMQLSRQARSELVRSQSAGILARLSETLPLEQR